MQGTNRSGEGREKSPLHMWRRIWVTTRRERKKKDEDNKWDEKKKKKKIYTRITAVPTVGHNE